MRHVALTALLAAALVIPSVAHGDGLPLLDRTTEVTGRGAVVVTVQVPAGQKLAEDDLDLSVSEGNFAFAGLSRKTCAPSLCFGWHIYQLRELQDPPNFHDGEFEYAQPDGAFPEGLYDLYIVTDGTATLTLRPTGRADAVPQRVEATQPVDAHLQDLGTTCSAPVGECASFAYGGAAHTLDRPGYAAVWAYAGSKPRDEIPLNPTSAQAGACLSPSNGPTPPDGAVHYDYGCAGRGDDPTDVIRLGGILLSGDFVKIGGGWNISGRFNNSALGEVYAGYVANSQTTRDPRRLGGYAMWIAGPGA